jgi:hypothetical protein
MKKEHGNKILPQIFCRNKLYASHLSFLYMFRFTFRSKSYSGLFVVVMAGYDIGELQLTVSSMRGVKC